MRFNLPCLVATAGVAFFAAAPSFADNPGKHPFYLHALVDLRDARANLEKSALDKVNTEIEQKHAIEHIDRAIDEVKRAAIDDGKDIHDHEPVDAKLRPDGRFHRALDLLEKAKRDAQGEEDQSDTKGLQKRVVGHIADAEVSVRHAIEIDMKAK
jgi:hypothetical protein